MDRSTKRTMLKCECGATLEAPAGVAAGRGKCPKCGRILELPPAPPLPHRHLVLRAPRTAVRALAFAKDLSLLVCGGCPDGGAVLPGKASGPAAMLWDPATGALLCTLEASRGTVTALALSADGQALVTGSSEHTLAVWSIGFGMWDAVIGTHEHTLRGHTAPVTSLSFSPDQTIVASGSLDQSIRIWETGSWQCQATLPTGRAGECYVAISPDGKSLAACFKSRGPTLLWDVANQREQVRLSLRREEDFDDLALAFAPGGGRLAVLSADQLRIWDLSTCQVLASIDSSGMSSLAFSPCGKQLATGGWDTSTHVAVRLWNADTGFELKAFEGPNLAVQSVAFSPDGGLVAAASLDGAIHLWSI